MRVRCELYDVIWCNECTGKVAGVWAVGSVAIIKDTDLPDSLHPSKAASTFSSSMLVQVRCMLGFIPRSLLALRHKSKVKSDVEPPERYSYRHCKGKVFVNEVCDVIPAPQVKSTNTGWWFFSSFISEKRDVTPADRDMWKGRSW